MEKMYLLFISVKPFFISYNYNNIYHFLFIFFSFYRKKQYIIPMTYKLIIIHDVSCTQSSNYFINAKLYKDMLILYLL